MDGGARRATGHGVTESDIPLAVRWWVSMTQNMSFPIKLSDTASNTLPGFSPPVW